MTWGLVGVGRWKGVREPQIGPSNAEGEAQDRGETASTIPNNRQHFLAEQPNVAHGRLLGHARLLPIENRAGHAQPVVQVLQLLQHHVGRSADDVVILIASR